MKKIANIYLVDDDEAVRHALITLLSTSGYTASGFDSTELRKDSAESNPLAV